MKKQNRENLPASILEERRFFQLLGKRKDATPTGWNNPDNWKELDAIPDGAPFGFSVTNNSNYLLIDADHVIDDNGEMLPGAQKAIDRIFHHGDIRTYWERSISGHGMHWLLDLGDYADSFSYTTNSPDSLILFMPVEKYRALSEEEQKATPKIELFYRTGGRYVVLTGDNSGDVVELATDEAAAEVFRECNKLIAECHPNETDQEKEAARPVDDATKERIKRALKFIDSDNYDTWVRIGIALRNSGMPFEVWDEWSRTRKDGTKNAKYNDGNDLSPDKKWKSFAKSSRWNAGTIFRMAKEAGWTESGKGSSGSGEKAKTLEPSDYTDLGQANVFFEQYGNIVRYSKATGPLVFTGKVWEESDIKAQRLSQELTERQLKEARKRLRKAREALDEIAEKSANSLIDPLESKSEKKQAEKWVEQEQFYYNYVLKRRKSNTISATLTEVRPKVEIDVSELDADGFLLNTPGGAVNLRTGDIRIHDPKDYCTKITAVAPDADNAEMFAEFLDRLTVRDKELEQYLQEIAGMCIIGKVLWECLIIAYGEGGNGKSTFFNLLARVLGDYAGGLSAETLTANCRKNKSPEYAELRGKRLIIAAELEEGMRLDTAVVKKLCSTDPILAEKKYKDPFTFTPSHTIVLYTNHLPKIGTTDKGTWDRIIAIPFLARFRGESGEIKNYADYLFEHCGGAVLAWMIEGAQRFIENNYNIEQPECVRAAIAEYRSDNDWLNTFLEECCEIDPTYSQAAGDLLKRYRNYCETTGEYCRYQADFKQALTAAGFDTHKTKKGAFVYGLKLKDSIVDLLNRQKGSASQTA